MTEKKSIMNGHSPSRPLTRRAFAALGLACALGMAVPLPAFADQLDDMRKSGAVGERYDGFLEARDASARSYVQQVNAQRRKIYEDRAAQQGVGVEQVGKLYAQQISKKAPGGTYFLLENGSWVQK